ncbi:MAG: MoaD/ThiS family protein [Spirochaetes bacterium]|nr:MoaD/ThiS family protein [Spirochaetota bacterium]
MGEGSIRVRVTGAGPLRRYVGTGEVELPRGATAGELVSRYGIPGGMQAIVLVGGTRRPPGTVLRDGDVVAIVSLLAGG